MSTTACQRFCKSISGLTLRNTRHSVTLRPSQRYALPIAIDTSAERRSPPGFSRFSGPNTWLALGCVPPRLKAFFLLLWALLRRPAARAVPRAERTGSRLSRETTMRTACRRSPSASERELTEFGRCIACGLCDRGEATRIAAVGRRLPRRDVACSRRLAQHAGLPARPRELRLTCPTKFSPKRSASARRASRCDASPASCEKKRSELERSCRRRRCARRRSRLPR